MRLSGTDFKGQITNKIEAIVYIDDEMHGKQTTKRMAECQVHHIFFQKIFNYGACCDKRFFKWFCRMLLNSKIGKIES